VPLNGWAEARKGLIAGRSEFPGGGEARMRRVERDRRGGAEGRARRRSVFPAASSDCFHMRRNTRESQRLSHPNQGALYGPSSEQIGGDPPRRGRETGPDARLDCR
jgi:hypothetical protein